MSDQEEQTLEPESPAEAGTDDGFSSAQDALSNEEAPMDEASTPQETDDSLDHKERSRLGRRLSKYEQEIEGLKATISQLGQNLQQRTPFQPGAINQVSDKPPVDYITTPEDLEAYESWKVKRMEQQRNQYAQHYIHNIKNMSFVNPDLHSEIETELLTNVDDYPTYSKYRDPVSDARTNYMAAENKILKRRLVGTVPRPNIKGGTNAPTGVSATSRMNNIPKPAPKLDEYAEKFLRSIGETSDAEWVQKSVARKE